MSADLFALFGDQTATPQKNQNQQTAGASTTFTPAASDPFSFLTSPTSATQLQPQPQPQLQPQISQQSTQWPPFQQSAAAQPSSWLASQINEPQKGGSSGWDSFGTSGGLGGFQSQSASFQLTQEPAQTEEDDDGWGDFEVAQVNAPPPPPAPVTVANPPRGRVMRASTMDMMTNKLLDLDLEAPTPEPWQNRPSWEKDAKPQQPHKPARNPDPDVLFDADFEADNGVNEDDDFGDFETGTPAEIIPKAATATSALDLLSLDSIQAQPKKQPPGLTLSNAALQTSPASYPEAPKSPYGSFLDRKPEPVKQLQVKPPTVTKILQDANEVSPSPVTAWPSVEADGFGNQWEEFRDLPDTTKPAASKQALKPKSNPASTSTPAAAPDWEWQDWGATEDQAASTTKPPLATSEPAPGPPPTNIPPPAILLSLFPHLLDLASTTLLKPLLTLSPSSPAYQRVIASEQTLNFLRGYLSLATVAARLIAGRKHRWHRDKFLAQSMSISAAPAGGGQRGMKLASVDKSQAAHDDREAAEVVGVWKRQVGRLRGVVAGVNAAHQAEGVNLRVPEMAEALLKGAGGVRVWSVG
ncbi:hypothetical protein NEMBOFW57_000532 [Staphylotrichum longicolle]|uniref:Uncharacterized protein n=1 Tax=Staphylotrichum longicolle TaxID=669026 RepID=A0AAD4F0A1_9PEZI|nr:hypothetical protein NEMBOFW57_000532 [Staphylotrichum longicolle]